MGPLIAKYAVPGAVGLVFFSLQSVIDGIIVGRLIGTDALAGVSIAAPAYAVLTSAAIVVSIGTQAQMGISLGRRDYAKTKSALKTGLMAVAAFSALFCAIIMAFPSATAKMLGADGALEPYCASYIEGMTPFVVPAACFYFFDYALKALGRPRLAMGIMVGSVLMNAALSVLFVAEFGMGTFGVGAATGISLLAGGAAAGFAVLRRTRRAKKFQGKTGRFSFRLLGRILYNGSSEGVSEMAMGITLFLFNITLLKYAGDDGVAAFAVINYVIFLGTSIILGVSDGVIPVISFNHGAGLWDRVCLAAKIAIKSNFIIGCVFLAVLWFGGDAIISLFLDGSEGKVAEIAVMGAKIMGFAFLLNGFNILSSSLFTAIDNAKLSLIIAFLRGFAFIAAGIAVLPEFFGVAGIFMTVPIAELLTAAIAAMLLKREALKRRPLIAA